MLFGLLCVVGAPLRIFALLLTVAAAAVAALAVAEPYRFARVTRFLDPSRDLAGHRLPAAHGHVRPGHRRLVRGRAGRSREKWGALPEAHTDFIFAIIGEELGLVGAADRARCCSRRWPTAGCGCALRTADPFVRLAAAGGSPRGSSARRWSTSGQCCRLLPITGVPLPLISYGGSSLLPTLIALGMLACSPGTSRPPRPAGRPRPGGPAAPAAGAAGARQPAPALPGQSIG